MTVKSIYKNGSISATALTDFYAKKILCLIIIAATMFTLVACEDNPNAQGCEPRLM